MNDSGNRTRWQSATTQVCTTTELKAEKFWPGGRCILKMLELRKFWPEGRCNHKVLERSRERDKRSSVVDEGGMGIAGGIGRSLDHPHGFELGQYFSDSSYVIWIPRLRMRNSLRMTVRSFSCALLCSVTVCEKATSSAFGRVVRIHSASSLG